MPVFNIVVSRRAQSDFTNLPPDIRLRVLRGIKQLEDAPFPRGDTIRQIQNVPGSIYRLRVGAYRIIYRIEDTQVVILRAVHRQAFERALRTLRF